MDKEPEITINGVRLAEAQAMTVRVALTSFEHEMIQPDALGKDEHGRRMADAYAERAREVYRIMGFRE